MTQVSSDLALKIAHDLVAIPSPNPPGNEGAVGQYIFDYLTRIGLSPQKQIYDASRNRFNVIVAGKNPSLMINGHMDTVPVGNINRWRRNPAGEIADGKLYGRGSADTKGQIACLMAAMTTHYNDTIAYVFNAEEEQTLGGITKVLELRDSTLKNVRYSISLEPTDGAIMIGNKGQYFMSVTAQGKTAHGSQPELGINAIYSAAGAALKIEAYHQELTHRHHPLFDHASINVGVISGGEAPNIVPETATMLIDRRVLPNEKAEDIVSELRERVAPLEVIVLKQVEPCETPAMAAIVITMQSILKALGIDSGLQGFRATSELSEIRRHGIEGIIYGPAQLDQAHQSDEYITLDQLQTGTVVLQRLLEQWK